LPTITAKGMEPFWVAVEGTQVVGMFGLEPSSTGAMELRRMYVNPDARRRGIASSMLQFAKDESADAIDRGWNSVPPKCKAPLCVSIEIQDMSWCGKKLSLRKATRLLAPVGLRETPLPTFGRGISPVGFRIPPQPLQEREIYVRVSIFNSPPSRLPSVNEYCGRECHSRESERFLNLGLELF
jgi:GNAT superfamily N-acetyltransferase